MDIIKELKDDNEKLKSLIEPMSKRVKEININQYTTYNEKKSVIMKEDELDFINQAIKLRINKEIKEMKKLYQANIHGDSAINFHSKCDNIPNILVFIKSAGNRRFGGFTTKELNDTTDDKNAFLFSLDKKKFIHLMEKNLIILLKNKNTQLAGILIPDQYLEVVI